MQCSCLQPSPLRTSSHHSALNSMEQNECDGVLSVVSVGRHPSYETLIGNKVVAILNKALKIWGHVKSLKVFIRNGAIYLSKQKLVG